MSLEINNLKVSSKEKEIVHGVDITIGLGEVHVVMGPNGSGKSTLVNAIAGNPKYRITGGQILVDRKEINNSKPEDIAKMGVLLSQQHPPEIPGIGVANFLQTCRSALTGERTNPIDFYKELKSLSNKLDFDESFLSRHINVNFSGGEKKKFEILQLLTLDPKYAILDETDSGLDVDALKTVSKGINVFKKKNKGILIITHNSGITKYVEPDYVHVMVEGRIVESGKSELVEQIEKLGYNNYYEK